MPGIGAASALGAAGALKIARLEYWRLEGRRPMTPGTGRQPMVSPGAGARADPDAWYRDQPGAPTRIPIRYNYLRVIAGSGLDGLYGPVDEEALFTLDKRLKPLVLGADALAHGALWDRLYKARALASAGKTVMAAISAIDNALWDLRGKHFQLPVHVLLGGPARRAVRAYASCKNDSQHPDDMARRVAALKGAGFRAFKYFFTYSPADGPTGLRRNEELARDLRAAAGPDCDIMFDAFMSWDLPYAIEWAKRAEPYRPAWVEECFPPDRIMDYARLARATSIPVAAGEHLYGRQDVREYLEQGAVSVLQCDPEWCGGVGELSRICAMAAPFGVRVIPHGQNLHAALHAAGSQPEELCPSIEYLVSYMEYRHFFEKAPPRLENGQIGLPETPGFGIELDAGKIERKTELKWN